MRCRSWFASSDLLGEIHFAPSRIIQLTRRRRNFPRGSRPGGMILRLLQRVQHSSSLGLHEPTGQRRARGRSHVALRAGKTSSQTPGSEQTPTALDTRAGLLCAAVSALPARVVVSIRNQLGSNNYSIGLKKGYLYSITLIMRRCLRQCLKTRHQSKSHSLLVPTSPTYYLSSRLFSPSIEARECCHRSLRI